MTLTKVDEQTKEYSNSVLYQLDRNSNTFLNEMKFEMTCNNKTNGMTGLLDGKNKDGNELKSAAVPIGSSVLSAAVDISKLANFGKTRRESSSLSHSRSLVYLDTSSSVLPSRTLLRRQRRIQSQDADDKQEDSIERLNRLRARISGALSEVKGVLKHYSTDDSAEPEQSKIKTDDELEKSETQPPVTAILNITNNGPVSFRFVKKIRRRSTFSEDDAGEVEKETEKGFLEYTNHNETASCTISEKGEVIEIDAISGIKVNNSTELAYLKTSVINEYPMDNKLKKISTEETENQEKTFGKSKSIIRRTEIAAVESSLNDPPFQQTNLESFTHVNNVKLCPSKNIDDDIDEKYKGQVESSRIGIKVNNTAEPAYLKTSVINEYPMDNKLTKISVEETENQEKTFGKSKSIIRRASIAAVESSLIDPPFQQTIPIAVKIERRPSDSETVIKRKSKTSANFASNTKEKVKVTIVKRLPVKNKTDAIVRNGKALKKKQYNNNAEGASSNTTEETSAVKATSNVAMPSTSDTLSTQLAITVAIDDASLRSAERPDDMKSEAMQPLSMTTNNSWSPTHSVNGDGVMVAALVNSLQTVEASSHTKHVETQPSNALINSEKVIKPVIEKVEKHTIVDIQSDIKATPTRCLDTQPEFNLESNLQVVNNLNLLESSDKFKNTAQLVVKNKDTDYVSSCIKKTQNPERQITPNATNQLLLSPPIDIRISDKMPELQVTPTPVKPLHVFAENKADKINNPTMNTTVNQIISKTPVDESPEITKLDDSSCTKIEEPEEDEITENQLSGGISFEIPPSASEENILSNEISITAENAIEALVAPLQLKKNRKVKKKVIIKRQHRKLSVGENTFFKDTDQPDCLPAASETLEKAIAYVTDDEDDIVGNDVNPAMPIKSCMKAREFQVGDWVMYGERFRKTQIRWKKGQISERITSISYKINIDDKEVSAHINYIKKFTGRRVNFGGKEYLEIDYEQIAEEERRAHTYSIWNMV
ncbi:uncharacterized protein LOC105213020 [Zeugodacus cucurbitae]|uniref:uncharacterized protein LOC105213020 n=1 Tax=Zeugodacus cucurbitae TaxID=28588 RepID=UPI0023D95451|nr:uncharacterized protein LOC105213020 [Zeugodacus cucurbitae]